MVATIMINMDAKEYPWDVRLVKDINFVKAVILKIIANLEQSKMLSCMAMILAERVCTSGDIGGVAVGVGM